MKLIKIIVFIVIALIISFGAYWQFFAYKNEQILLNSTNQLLTENNKNFKSINSDSLHNLYNSIKENLIFIQQHSDTINKETAIDLAKYQSIQTPLGKIINNNSKINAELNYINSQLNKLQLDIESRNITEANAKTAIQSEFKKLKNIDVQIKKTKKMLPVLKKHFEEVELKVKAIIMRLISNKK